MDDPFPPEEEEAELLLLDEPTVSPTEPLTAVTVPEIGARSLVAASACTSFETVIASCATCARSCATVDGSTAELIFAWAAATLCSCCATVERCELKVCWAVARVC